MGLLLPTAGMQEQSRTLHEQLYEEAAKRQARQRASASAPPPGATFRPAIIVRPPDTGRVLGSELPDGGSKEQGLVDRRVPCSFISLFPHLVPQHWWCDARWARCG